MLAYDPVQPLARFPRGVRYITPTFCTANVSLVEKRLNRC